MTRLRATAAVLALTAILLLAGNSAAASTSDTVIVRGQNVTVSGDQCDIDGADRGIIVTGTARDVVIHDCHISNTRRSGIVVWGTAENVVISNTTIDNPGLDGITAYDDRTVDLKLSNVTVRDAANHGAHLGGTSVSVVNFTSTGHTHAGLMVANHINRPWVHNVVVTNLITEGGRWGLWLRRAHRVDLGPAVIVEGRTLIQDCFWVDGSPCPNSR